MRKSITHLAGALAIAAPALLLAGCGGDNAASATPHTSAAISVGTVDGHDVLVDADGHTLYTAAVERAGIRCVDTCEQFWKPVFAASTDVSTAGSDLRSELGTVDRPDGTSQVTYEGLPLYTFTQEDAGQTSGDGFTDDFQGTHFEWAAARPDGSDAGPARGSSSPSGGSGYGY